MKLDDARFAAKSLQPTNMQTHKPAHTVVPTDGAPHYVRVKSVRRRMAEPVYNMEVERHHNFAVNGGLIVHNCLDSTRYACEPEIGRKIATTRSDIY